ELGDGSRYSISAVQSSSDGLDGNFIFQAWDSSTAVANYRAEFRSQVLGHDCSTPRRPELWFGEGGTVDMAECAADGVSPAEGTGSSEPATFVGPHFRPRPPVEVPADSDALETLVEVLAALSLRRQWIDESDVLTWMGRLLRVERELLWQVLRAWLEAGYLDC